MTIPDGGWPGQDQDAPTAGAHAQPERIGPEPPTRRPSRRKWWLAALALLLVLAAAGTASALPSVANRLELPWAPNAPVAPEPEPADVERVLVGPSDSAEGPTQQGVDGVMSDAVDDPALGELSGVVIDPGPGAALWEDDADNPLPPASAAKLATGAAALLVLDHDAVQTTRVVRGDDPGSIVLVGGGDPTLSSLAADETSVYPGAAHLDDLVDQVREATGGDVTDVAIDLSAYSGDNVGPGWAAEDAPSTYAAPITAAMLDGARTDPTNRDSPRTGDPAGALAAELAARLGADVAGSDVTAPEGAEVIGEVRSAPMVELVQLMLAESDNVLAEAIARQVAIATGNEPSFEGAADATLDVLSEAGFDVGDASLVDGSGLSADNELTATLLAELLSAAAAPAGDDPRTAMLRPLLGGLPVAGGTGTLADRYDSSPEGRGWVRAKTGTLSEMNSLAGIVLTEDGHLLVFALLSAGTSADVARPALDAVAAALRTCGCR